MTISIKDQLNTILGSIFDGELYPLVHPDPDGLTGDVAGLYAIYTIIGGQSFNKLDGNSDLSRPRIQISIYSIDYTDLDTKMKAVDTAMNAANDLAGTYIGTGIDCFEIAGALPNVSTTVPTEGFETDTRRFCAHMTYYCWNRS